MHGLFSEKIKKELQLLMLLKQLKMNLIANQNMGKSSEFYNTLMKSWLEKNEIEIEMLLMILMEKKLLKRFTKTNGKKQDKKNLKLKK